MKIVIVDDEACPLCGARWGHEDPALDFPNRPKVTDEEGEWWRCYNPACVLGYWLPGTKKWEAKPSPERAAQQRAAAQAYVARISFGKVWKETEPGVWKLVPE